MPLTSDKDRSSELNRGAEDTKNRRYKMILILFILISLAAILLLGCDILFKLFTGG